MGFNTAGAASGAAAGSSFGPWGAAIGGLAGGLMGGSGSPPSAPQLPAYRTPGAVTGTYGSSYIDPVTGQVSYNSNAQQASSTSLMNQNLQSQLMGYGGTSGNLDSLINQYRAKVGTPGSATATGTTGSPFAFDASQFTLPGGGFSPQQQTQQSNQAALATQKASDQAYLDQLLQTKAQMGQSNPILDYLNHGPDNLNYVQGNVTNQFKNAQLANQNANAARGMGSSSMSEIGNAANAQNLALGIQGAQSQAGQQNFANRNTMLNYLSGQNAQDLSAEQMRGNLYNQQMGMGQGVSQNLSNAIASQNAAQAGLNFQGNMAQFNANQANTAQTNNSLGSLGSALGNYNGQQNTNNLMQQWLNNQNQVNNPNTMQNQNYDMSQQMGGYNYTPYPTVP